MDEFRVMHVDRSRSQSVETLGSKPKFWFSDGNRRMLFKADDRGTGEDWAEIIACHLCGLLGLPHVEYELAAEFHDGKYVLPGVVCENMASKPDVLVLGNELLLALDPQYPQAQRFKVRQHTVDAVCDVVKQFDVPRHHLFASLPDGIKSALDVFIGYVMLDVWIANQDRHHENWGALWDDRTYRLAPTFDHGAALARNLTDAEREERLTTRDRNRTIAAFVAKGRSAFYGSPTDQRALELREAFRIFATHSPTASKAWLDRLRTVNQDQIWRILDRVPVARMSEVAKRFTIELLNGNRGRLLEEGVAQ